MKNVLNISYGQHYFQRSLEDVLRDGFFNSLDSNVVESETAYSIEVGVPGLTKDDLNVSLEHNKLVINGQRKFRRNDFLHYEEFQYQYRNRSFLIPEDADKKGITACCKNGLLTIDIPKKNHFESDKVIKIEDVVEVEDQFEKHFFRRIMEKLKALIKRMK